MSSSQMPTAAGSAESVDHCIGLLEQADLDEDIRADYAQALRALAGVLEQDPEAITVKRVVIAPGNPERDKLLLHYCERLASTEQQVASNNLIAAAKALREFKTPDIEKKLEENFELIKDLLAKNTSLTESTKQNHEIALKALAYLLAHFPGPLDMSQILRGPENAGRALLEKYKLYFEARGLKTAELSFLAAVNGMREHNNPNTDGIDDIFAGAGLSASTIAVYAAALRELREWQTNIREQDIEAPTFDDLVDAEGDAQVNQAVQDCKNYLEAAGKKTAATHLLAAVKGIRKRNATTPMLKKSYDHINRVLDAADLSPVTKRNYRASMTAAAEWLPEDDERGTFEALVNPRRPAKDDPIVQECTSHLASNNKPNAAKYLAVAIDFFRPEPLHEPFVRLLVRAADLSDGTLSHYKTALNALEQWLEDNPQDRTLAEILTARGDAAQDRTLQQCKHHFQTKRKRTAATHLFPAVNTVRRTIQTVKQEDYRLIDRLLARISANFNTDCYKVALTALADWLAQDPQDRTLAQILAEVGPVDDDDGILSACKRHLEACGMTDAATYLIPAVNAVRPVNTDRGNLPEPDIAEVQRSDFVSVVEEMAKLYLAPEEVPEFYKDRVKRLQALANEEDEEEEE